MTHDDNDSSLPPQHSLPLDRDERFQALEQLAATDPLTGLANRRGCEKSIAAELSRADRQRKPLSVVVLDINHLKDVNETYGYLAGDRVLREISTVLRRAIRPYDILARWGADEFVIVLPGVDLEQAQRVAVRVRSAVSTHAIEGVCSVSVASGVSEFDSDFDFAAILRDAYRRLNQAKRSGEADSDPLAAVREPRPRGPEGRTDRTSAASVDEPEPERRVDAIRRSGWPLP